MSVEQFTEGIEPDDPEAIIWRFMPLERFRDLVETGQLYFRRSDKLEDEHEGLPSVEFARLALNLNRYDINDIHTLNNDLGSTAQFRQSFYINCWHLFDQETAAMWAKYGRDGVAIVSRYSLLKTVLEPIPDRPHVGLVRYGWKLGTRWNLLRFITTKREEYAHEREVRAMLWLLNSGDGVNRHIDIDNRVHPLPIYDPPETLPLGVKRSIDLRTLINKVVVTPNASAAVLAEVETLLTTAGLHIPTIRSGLTQYANFIPTADELSRFK
jgi:hypothetical protein